ncbi:MAG: hypothetical protein GF341_13185 [candidate division Zixibacteria bacterium]|nr:hypothetical protein [candidate division Zixibacteria bacterium]
MRRRRRESKIGGAGSGNTLWIRLKGSAILALISVALACPIACLFIHNWYSGFAYHAAIGIGTYSLAGGLGLAIALLTTVFHSVRAAVRSPVLALRSE